MITRHNLIVTTTIVIIVLCTLIIDVVQTKNVDCKTIDKDKFKETFEFSYGGGPKGLELKFNFINKNSKDFKLGDCKFSLIDGKFFQINYTSYKRIADRKMSALQPCTKYRLDLTIKNLADKAQFSYENFVTSRPENNMVLELVPVNVSDTSVTFKTASKVSDACFVRYQLTVKNALKEVIYENSSIITSEMSLESLSPSQTYSAQIMAFDDKTSKISSKVIEFKTKSNDKCNEINEPDALIEKKNLASDSVLLKWNSNSAENIHHLEIIDATGSSVFSANVSNNSAPINNLKACNEYTARLTIPCATKVASTNFRTLASMPGEVRDINFNSNHTHSMISWSPPELNVDCITNYVIKLQKAKGSNDSISFIVDKNKSSLVLPRRPYSKKLTVHVYANWSTLNNSVVINNSTGKEFEHIDTNKFIVEAISEFRLSPSELQLRWSLNVNFADILKEFQVFYLDKVITTNQPLINLKIKACKVNYTILIRCSSHSGNFGPNITYQTSLDDDSVQLSAISESSFSYKETNNSFRISWIATKEEAPCIAFYEITLNDQNFKSNESMKEFHDFLPCITYRLGITPVSERGTKGKITFYEFTTNVIAPKAPSKPEFVKIGNRELNLSSTISSNDKYCGLMSPTFIVFECNGKVGRQQIEGSELNYVVAKTSIDELQPNTQYNCTAFVTNEKGSSPKSEMAMITTLQESPQSPVDVEFIVNLNNTVFVKWSPNNSTGFTDYYKIHLKLQRLLYDISTECPWNFKNYSIIEALENHHHLNDLAAYAEYSLKITSINAQGSSNFSQELFFRTYPSTSSPVRDISVDFKTHENSSLSAHLTWKPPCVLNGQFSLYTVSMHGSRKGFGSQEGIEAGQMNEIDLNNLKMGYTYDVEVKANVLKYNEHGNILGESAKQKFLTPSGVPLENDLIEWTNIHPATVHHDRAEIFLKRRIFISSVGDITGISLLIFLNNCPDLPQPTFGYLSHESETHLLPASQGVMNCSQLYQQTEILQNPLDHDSEVDSSDLDVFNIKFILGDGKCPRDSAHQYCNKPLLPGVEYGVFARIFTKDAFRDTQPIFFETRSSESLPFGPTLIIAGSLGALILISILISLCCWLSIKRQRKSKKKKESAETVENLLSFTSYCVIDKNPTPRNQFDPLL